MLPNSTPKMSQDDLIALLLSSGLWSNRKVSRCSVIGIRGYYLDSMGRAGRNDRGIYDDALFVLSPDTYTAFNGNTDPSRYRQRIAVLKAPQRVTYRPGFHGYGRASGHKAFRQASTVTVTRDGIGDDTDRPNRRFWINLHRGGRTTTSSAGCQTVPPNQWDAFYSLVMLQLKRFRQETFSYYLIAP